MTARLATIAPVTFAEAVKEILLDCSRAPERPTPGLLAELVSRQAERYLPDNIYDEFMERLVDRASNAEIRGHFPQRSKP